MAQYTITRRCGHTETIQLYGSNTHGQHERRAAREAERLCTPCYRAQRAEQAQQAAAALDLPEITTGSPRQITWATQLRARAVQALGEHAATAPVRAVLQDHTDAHWWITHRHDLPEAILTEAEPMPPVDEITREILEDDRAASVDDPTWQPWRGTRRPAPLQLRPDAARAWRLWQHLTQDGGRLDDAVLREWLTRRQGTVAAALVETALRDAAGRRGRTPSLETGWQVAQRLVALHADLTPAPAPVAATPAPADTCRHGRRYNEDCPDCDAEFD